VGSTRKGRKAPLITGERMVEQGSAGHSKEVQTDGSAPAEEVEGRSASSNSTKGGGT